MQVKVKKPLSIVLLALLTSLMLTGCIKIDIDQHYGIDNKLWQEMTPDQQQQVRQAYEHSRQQLQTISPKEN